MPEEGSDKFRESKELPTGLKKTAYPTHPMIFTTDDEAYQFRRPDVAYMEKGIVHELPDGLQSDGTPARHWGEVPVAHEDNAETLRHNQNEVYPSAGERAQLAKERGVAAAKISDPERKKKFIAAQGEEESRGPMARPAYNRLKREAAEEL